MMGVTTPRTKAAKPADSTAHLTPKALKKAVKNFTHFTQKLKVGCFSFDRDEPIDISQDDPVPVNPAGISENAAVAVEHMCTSEESLVSPEGMKDAARMVLEPDPPVERLNMHEKNIVLATRWGTAPPSWGPRESYLTRGILPEGAPSTWGHVGAHHMKPDFNFVAHVDDWDDSGDGHRDRDDSDDDCQALTSVDGDGNSEGILEELDLFQDNNWSVDGDGNSEGKVLDEIDLLQVDNSQLSYMSQAYPGPVSRYGYEIFGNGFDLCGQKRM